MSNFMRHQRLLFFVASILLVTQEAYSQSPSSGTADGSESWGYVDVRPGAHMFWWLYKSPYQNRSEWPLILWLQGGPGASGVGLGNFGEIGPLNEDLLPRNETWLRKADLLFVDSPVDTGFSYVDNSSLIPRNDMAVTEDLVTMVKYIFQEKIELQGSPLFIVGESYGGKIACLLGLALSKQIASGGLKLNLQGVALGDSWISPVDYVLSWGPVLRTMSRVDGNQEKVIYRKAKEIESLINNGAFGNATSSWDNLQYTIQEFSSNVDFYNILIDESQDNSSEATFSGSFARRIASMNMKRLRTLAQSPPDLESKMNGPVRNKLKIIPPSVSWVEISDAVFDALQDVFMKDVIEQVDELLSTGVNVTIYNGQVDLICATLGTEAWVEKLKWSGLQTFNAAPRKPLMSCNSSDLTAAFVKSHENLSFYWILLAGHMVPVDQPCMALEMIGMITAR